MDRPYHCQELQSFRGLAALTVLLWHCSQFFVLTHALGELFNAVFDAAAAVISFFVLSGFVLALSQLQRPIDVREAAMFYMRRAFRIYPALWLAMVPAIACQLLVFGRHLDPSISDNAISALTTKMLQPRGLLTTSIGKVTDLPLPVWTLNIELFASLMLPAMLWVLVRRPRLLGPILLVLLLVRMAAGDRFNNMPVFLIAFLFGMMLVRVIEPLRAFIRSFRAMRLLALSGLLILWPVRMLAAAWAGTPYGAASVLVGSAGAAMIIAAIYARPPAFTLLALPPLTWLGEISYSLYLLHMPIMGFLGLGLARLYGVDLPGHTLAATLLLMLVTTAGSVLAASVSYLYVELPGSAAGKACVRSLRTRLQWVPALGM